VSDRTGRRRVLSVLAIALAGTVGLIAYQSQRHESAAETPALIGVVRETEIHVAPEISGRLQMVLAAAGQRVKTGDALAVLSAPELTASAAQAKAAAGQARADRDNVYAGVRKEEIDISAANVKAAEANLGLAQQQYARAEALAARDFASKQQFDEMTASLSEAEARLEMARSLDARNRVGPTQEERAAAEARSALADAAAADVDAQRAKTTLTAPIDGAVGALIGSPGEIISAGETVMTMTGGAGRWFDFTVREDRLRGVAVGANVKVRLADGGTIDGRVTELRPLGEFATWRAARAVGDHDLNSFFVRVDPLAARAAPEPGKTVWLEPPG
jgi:HlyD family secretion protein